MKKSLIYILCLSITFLVCSDNVLASIMVHKQLKGPNGYDKVDETHENGNHKLDCKNPGLDQCSWEFPPSIVTSTNIYDVEVIASDVEAQIAGGTLNGSYTLDGELSVTWDAADVDTYTLTIDEIGE